MSQPQKHSSDKQLNSGYARLSRGPIRWMAGNSVASNLLMLALLIGGFFWGTQIKQEIFPEFNLDQVVVSVIYPGASPEEVSEGIVLPIEEAIENVDGIEEVVSTAYEGRGVVRVEARIDADLQLLATDIKNEVDRIYAFPEDAETPLVSVPSHKRKVMTLLVYGEQNHKVLREVTEMVRDQLLQDPGITQLELLGERPLEMSIEVPQAVLQAYSLTLAQIAHKVRGAAHDIPGGTIKTSGGEILVRMTERKDFKAEFAKIPIVSRANGTMVTLGEIATIKDGFEDIDRYLFFNDQPALGIDVFRVGKQTPITVSKAVTEQVLRLNKILPDGVSVVSVEDRSDHFKQRISLLVRNGYLGLALVFILLAVFLEMRLAFWVTMGIPISFLGALLFIPFFGVSINMVSLFAFIIALGIVVDDAIVVGENIYHYKQQGYNSFAAAVKGVREVAVPVTFSILTNIVTFLPLYFVPGIMGKIFRQIPVVVISVFLISLIESIFVLPAHIGHQREIKNPVFIFITRKQQQLSAGIKSFIHNVYGPFLRFSLRFRYVSLTVGVIILMVTLAYVKSGRMGMSLFPKVESDYAYAKAVLPVGVPVAETLAISAKIRAGASQLADEIGREKQIDGILSYVDQNSTWTKVFMTPPDERVLHTGAFVKRWRQLVGGVVGVETLQFKSDMGGPSSGAALTVELQHRDTEVLESASAELATALASFPMVSDIDDGFTPGKDQFDFTLKPAGFQLGLQPRDVARQIRNSYYGDEVLRQLRGRNEMKIMVRLPESERELEYSLEEMLIMTPKGVEVPLLDVVNIKKGKAYTLIERRDGRRIVNVTCDVTPHSHADQVMSVLKKEIIPELKEKYHGLNFSFAGKQSDRIESMAALAKGMMVAMVAIYMLLAIPFRSYIQPAIIMVSIPFGIVGAIVGHLLLGYSLSLLSMFGIVALSGVVVNDSLVLIDYANRCRITDGASAYIAITKAGIQRFRPIILTTMTTFFGLMPMMFETSRQARFLIPMAISLGFGILFSTLIILILVPALYIILEDIKKLVSGLIS